MPDWGHVKHEITRDSINLALRRPCYEQQSLATPVARGVSSVELGTSRVHQRQQTFVGWLEPLESQAAEERARDGSEGRESTYNM